MLTTNNSTSNVQEEGRVAECRHYWVIDPPVGPTSRGVCHLCGAERQFSNHIKGTEWETSDPAPAEIERLPVPAGTAADERQGEE